MKKYLTRCIVYTLIVVILISIYCALIFSNNYSERNTVGFSATTKRADIVQEGGANGLRIVTEEYGTVILVPSNVWSKIQRQNNNVFQKGAIIEFRVPQKFADEFERNFFSIATALQVNGECLYDVNEYNAIIWDEFRPGRILCICLVVLFIVLLLKNAKKYRSIKQKHPDDGLPENNGTQGSTGGRFVRK